MSGHSKWASIKHKKAAADAQRGKIFSRLIREITVAAREGGGSPDANARLRTVIGKAREANMPLDNIERAIRRGTGEEPGVSYEEITYEGYGPGGVAILVATMTDNKNRTASDVRTIFNRKNGSMGSAGSVAWMFRMKGLFTIEKGATDEDRIMSVAIDAGAEDFKSDGDAYEITTGPSEYEAVKQALQDAGVTCLSAELTMIPENTIKVTGEDVKKLMILIDALEEHDDVQNVYANFDISDEVLSALSGD